MAQARIPMRSRSKQDGGRGMAATTQQPRTKASRRTTTGPGLLQLISS